MQIFPRSYVAALFFVGITLGACEEAAAPEGQPGDITVTAYVDEVRIDRGREVVFAGGQEDA